MLKLKFHICWAYYNFTVFHCKNDLDCYNKGICNDGVCVCQAGWQEQADCTGT